MRNTWKYKALGRTWNSIGVYSDKKAEVAIIGREPEYKPYLRIEIDENNIAFLDNKARLRNLAHAILTAIGDK